MGIYQYTFGATELTIINIGQRDYPGDVIFGNIPQYERLPVFAEADIVDDTVSLSNNVVYIKTGTHEILVETGNRVLLDDLHSIGVDPAHITHIILTHGHGSHMAGFFDTDGNFAFPNATVICGKQEWDYCTSANRLNSDNKSAKVWRKLLDQLPIARVELVEVGALILPGITAVAASGHSPGQIGLLLKLEPTPILHIADAAHHTFQTHHADWSSDFDHNRDVARQTRHGLFEQAKAENWLILGYHFTAPGLGTIQDHTWVPYPHTTDKDV